MSKVHVLDRTISIKQACQLAGISRKTFYNWIRRGVVFKTYKQINRQVLVDKDDWLQLLERIRNEGF